ncbi:hypothetical protein [Clostridium beijerinckii]|uniref:hypothetical protein n=1 Tax=Clostridium beijerinckii TaxID=1520 RepID=UPI00047E633D|nr:hypothetical protein [Clostridium beijerinckii]
MKKLIYYKIDLCSDKGFREENAVIETKTNTMSIDEWKKFNRDAREWNNTYCRPIIINIMDIRE